jgi:hypothetical protein
MPTAARQKYLAKQAAKKSDLLSDTDRQAEYDKVMSQLTQVSDPEVDKFEALMSEWVKDGRVRQGVIPVPAIRRAICYSLGISRSKTFVSLRSDEPEKYTDTPQANTSATGAASAIPSSVVEDEEDELPVLVPSTASTSEPVSTVASVIKPFEETIREMTQEVLNNIGNTPTDEHYEKWHKTYQELTANDEKITGSATMKSKHEKTNEKTNDKKKKNTFTQPAPRGSRHASRPPTAMKPKAQSA